MEFRWHNVNIGKHFKLYIANLYNNELMERGNRNISPRIIVTMGDYSDISLKTVFNAYSRNSSKGLIHMLEHNLFSNVWKGMTLEQARTELQSYGIFLNAFTSANTMSIVTNTGIVLDSLDYNDELLLNKKNTFNIKEYFNKITEIHKNIITSPLNENFFNIQKNVILAEIDHTYPNDSSNIDKEHWLSYIYGQNVSVIGDKEIVSNTTFETLQEYKKYVMNLYTLKHIEISCPFETKFEDIEKYVNMVLDSISNIEGIDTESELFKDVCNPEPVFIEDHPFNPKNKYNKLDSFNVKKYHSTTGDTQYFGLAFRLCDTFKELATSHYIVVEALRNIMHEFFRSKYPFIYRIQVGFTEFDKFYGQFIGGSTNSDVSPDKICSAVEEFKKWILSDENEEYLFKNLRNMASKYLNAWNGIMIGDSTVVNNSILLDLYSASCTSLHGVLDYLDRVVVTDQDPKNPKYISDKLRHVYDPKDYYLAQLKSITKALLNNSVCYVLRAEDPSNQKE